MNNFNSKSIKDVYKHYQSLAVHNQFVLSLLAAKITLIHQQFASLIAVYSKVRRQHNRTIRKLSLWQSARAIVVR